VVILSEVDFFKRLLRFESRSLRLLLIKVLFRVTILGVLWLGIREQMRINILSRGRGIRISRSRSRPARSRSGWLSPQTRALSRWRDSSICLRPLRRSLLLRHLLLESCRRISWLLADIRWLLFNVGVSCKRVF